MARRFDSSLDDPATLAALGLTPADIALIKNPGSGGGGDGDDDGITLKSALKYLFETDNLILSVAVQGSAGIWDLGPNWSQKSIALSENTGFDGLSFPTLNTCDNGAGFTFSGRGAPSVLADNLTSMAGGATITLSGTTDLTTVSLSSLATIDGSNTLLQFLDNDLVSSIDLPALSSITNGAQLNINNNTGTVSVNLLSLSAISGGSHLNITNNLLFSALAMPLLATVGAGCFVTIEQNPVLTSLDLSAIETLSGGMIADSNPTLSSVDLSGLVTLGGGAYVFLAYNALTQPAVDSILIKLASIATLGSSGAVINLSGGDNAAPSSSGTDAAAVLTGLGVTVVTN